MKAAALGLTALCLLATGCGVDEGVAGNAAATVYVAASLCPGARREAARTGDRAGDVRVRVACLPVAERGHRLDLTTLGANARRATEDSTAVGYIGEPTPSATRFSRPILESAEIPQLSEMGGAVAMAKLLHAVDEAGSSGSLRESVYDALR